MALLLFLMLCLGTGCSKKEEASTTQTSLGVDNEVAGFLLNFDKREETAALIRYKNRGQFPISVSWYFGGDGRAEESEADAETEADQLAGTERALEESLSEGETEVDQLAGTERALEESPSEGETESDQMTGAERVLEESLSEGETEADQLAGTERASEEGLSEGETDADQLAGTEQAPEEKVSETETEEIQEVRGVTTTDPDVIRDLYYALSNTIVLGNATNQQTQEQYYISLILPDGIECRYDFVDKNTVRLSGQNYVIESDGSLWQIITYEGE